MALPAEDHEDTSVYSLAERQALSAAAAKGEIHPLSVLRKFIRSIRKSFKASPTLVEKGKTTRTKKVTVSEDQIDFF